MVLTQSFFGAPAPAMILQWSRDLVRDRIGRQLLTSLGAGHSSQG